MRKPQASSPCLGCESRYIGCHGKCEKYIEYAKVLKAENHALKDMEKKEHFISSYVDKRKRCISQGRRTAARTQHLGLGVVDITRHQQEDT